MRWATYRSAFDGAEHVALLVDGELHALAAGVRLTDLLDEGAASLERAAARARDRPFEVVPADGALLLAPVPRPPSVRDFMAFEDHYVATRRGLGLRVEPVFYEQPCFYFSNPAAIVGPTADVPLAPGTEQFDFELEIGAVIGRPGRDLHPDEAEAHVAGYTILCDWSARDLQATETAFGTGPAKGKDTATSLGPFLVTPDELEPFRDGNGYALAMTASVNGTRCSSGSWSSLFWSMGEMLAFASRGTELRPGDVVGTGTVGTGSIMELAAVHGGDAHPWLRVGDEVELRVEELGAIRSRVVASPPPTPLRATT
jgi:2-keto-4-pentenoate hydratase/2-oxohepta-3-ene-1,7-dioic acid hydratase in catechol pathway